MVKVERAGIIILGQVANDTYLLRAVSRDGVKSVHIFGVPFSLEIIDFCVSVCHVGAAGNLR